MDALRVDQIREELEYVGLRLRTTASISGARITVTVDVAFGDALEPGAEVIDYPSILDLSTPRLRAYARETVIEEKFQAMVALGRANSRMKDFYDLWLLSQSFSFDNDRLARAIAATFGRRETSIPAELPALLVADYTTPSLAEQLKARGVAFLDTAGNAYVDQPPLYVWVKGEKPKDQLTVRRGTGRALQASGLKVLFALLCHPEWIELPYRKICELTGVAHGTIGWVMAELPELGFVAEVAGKRRLLQPQLLLKQWAEAYARTLRPKLALGRCRPDKDNWWTKLRPGQYGAMCGGEPAAARLTHYLQPETVTLYAGKAEPRLLLDHKLHQDPEGPVEILERFWRFETDDNDVVPLPLVYADLPVTGDAPCLEVADLIYTEIVDGFVRKDGTPPETNQAAHVCRKS